MSHSGENIAEKISIVVEEFGLIDKIFAVTLDNASANSKAYDILQLVTWVLILHLHMMILTRSSICLCISVVPVISLISLSNLA